MAFLHPGTVEKKVCVGSLLRQPGHDEIKKLEDDESV